VRDAILRKARESAETKLRFVEESAQRIEACARALSQRLAAGGTLFVLGNGGSACDAAHVAVEFTHPVVERRRPLRSIALPNDAASMTAIGNDSDFACVFEHPLEVLAREGDAALGISTSGSSSNVNRALARARERGLLTIGFAGRDGGRMVGSCDYPFVVPAWSIHRVQETHTLLLHLLWDAVHIALGEDDVL
jgi:D-sedoheptulose 7-phosphate isomerase